MGCITLSVATVVTSMAQGPFLKQSSEFVIVEVHVTMLYMYYVYTKFLYQSQKVIFVMWHQRASIIIKTEETCLHSSSLAKGFRSTLLTIKPLADLITNAAAANHKIEPVADFS